MRRPVLGTLFALAACLILIPASTSATPEIGQKDNGYSLCDEAALVLYAEGMRKGFDFGRNRIEDGKLLPSGEVIPEPHPCEWRDYLDAQLNPPEPPAVDSSVIVAEAPVATSVPTTSAGGCPSYMAGEASTPTTYNAEGSGAAGCFQVMPGTAADHGCAVDQTTVPVSEQVVCAQRICATSGDGAWVAADPCAYLGTEP